MWLEEKSKIARRCGEKHILKWKCIKRVSCGPLSEITMSKNCTTTFRNYDVEKLDATVARSAFSSEHAQNTSVSDHFLPFRCRKIARRCGEKCIFKGKCIKHVSSGPLFAVPMSKNCTPLWREAHFQVKMLKNWGVRTTFWSLDIEKLHAAVARSTFVS